MLLPTIDWKELWGRRGFKGAVVALCAIVGLGGAGTAGYFLWPEPAPKPPPPPTATTQQARDYLASEDWNRLPLEQRTEWLEQRMRSMAGMEPEQRRAIMENMDEETRRRIGRNIRETMRQRMIQEVETFHRLPKDERVAFLDKKIDEMEARGWGPPGRGRGPRGRGGPPGPPRGRDGQARSGGERRGPDRRGGGDRASRQRRFHSREGGAGPGSWRSRIPADKRAEFESFRRAMQQRRTERGLSSRGGR